MQTKLLFGKVKCKLSEQLPHIHHPLKDNMHKAVLPSHWSHYLVLLSHSTWRSTADTHQVQKFNFAGKMTKIRSYMNHLPIREDNTLNTLMRAGATGTYNLYILFVITSYFSSSWPLYEHTGFWYWWWSCRSGLNEKRYVTALCQTLLTQPKFVTPLWKNILRKGRKS